MRNGSEFHKIGNTGTANSDLAWKSGAPALPAEFGETKMKKIILVVLVLVFLAGGALLWVTLNAGKIANQYKADLERVASQALDARVTFGELDAALFPETRIVADKVSVQPKDESTSGISFDNFTLRVELLALLGGKLDISQISLFKPTLKFINSASGIYLEGLPAPKSKKKQKAKTPPKQSQSADATNLPASKVEVPAGISLNLRTLEVRSARIIYADQVNNAEYSVENLNFFSSINLESNKINLNDLTIDAKNASAKQQNIPLNLSVRGNKLTYDLSSQLLDLSGLTFGAFGNDLEVSGKLNAGDMSGEFKLNSPGLNLTHYAALSPIVPALQTLNLRGLVTPKLNLNISGANSFTAQGQILLSDIGLNAGPVPVSNFGGVIDLNADQNKQMLRASKLKLSLGSNQSSLSFEAVNSKQKAGLSELVFEGFGGSAKLSGALQHTDAMPFDARLDVAGLQLEPMVNLVMPDSPATLTGRLESFAANIEGSLSAPDLMKALLGKFSITLKDGELKGSNIAGKTLLAITDLPFLSDNLYSRVPAEQREQLKSENTAIESLTGNFSIANGFMSTSNLNLLSTIFQLDSKGSIGFDTSIKFDSKIIYSELFSQAMISTTKELKALTDSKGRMVFPINLKGKGSSITVLPDMEEILKLLATNTLKEEAGNLLEGLLGGKKDGAGKSKGLGGMLGF